MIDFYPQSKQMIIDQSRVFIGALTKVHAGDLSIVIHKTACGAPCTAESVANFFATDTNVSSTHFIVGLDGEVVQCVNLADGAGGNCCLEVGHDTYWDVYHANYGNLNLCTISIEHVDQTTDNSEVPTQAQLNASYKLVSWLCQQFNISPDHIKTHASIDPISRAHCPGNYPMSSLIAYVKGAIQVDTNQEKSITDHWNSFFSAMRTVTGNTTLSLPPTSSGIFNAWQSLYLKDRQLGPATSYEYDSVDWNGNAIKCQDFGSCRIEYYYSTGAWYAYGPTGQIS